MSNEANFRECFDNGKINWKQFEFENSKHSPSQRHSHSSCRIKNSIYVFGGLSSTSTAYNDLWLFDLNSKIWSRPNTNGSYPSPKAAATMISHNNKLFLYGGYSHPYSYLHQQVSFFDEFHVFCTENSQWNQILFSQEAPKLAGHTASVINGNKMILFGGCNGSLGNKTNAVYCLDLDKFEWENYTSSTSTDSKLTLRELDGIKPECRYGHSQITLDEERVLIIGGCGGPNKQFDDVWILNWPKDKLAHAHWQKIIVNNLINSPAQNYCISFVFVGKDKKLITFGKPRIPPPASLASNSKIENRPAILNPYVGLIGEEFLNNTNYSNVYTITGNPKLTLPRKCTCLLAAPVLNKPSSPVSTLNPASPRLIILSNDFSKNYNFYVFFFK